MSKESVFVFLVPVPDYSSRESQELTLEELNELADKEKVEKYELQSFISTIDRVSDILTRNWIELRSDKMIIN